MKQTLFVKYNRTRKPEYQIRTSIVEEDGVRYVYARPYGLTGTDELQIFTAGMPVDQIPEGFLSWTGMYFDPETEDCLPFYGIYNAAEDCAFISME